MQFMKVLLLHVLVKETVASLLLLQYYPKILKKVAILLHWIEYGVWGLH